MGNVLAIIKSLLGIFGLFQQRNHETQIEGRGAAKVKQATTEDRIERMKRAEKHRDEHKDATPDDILERMRAKARRKSNG